jgi:hypothetical protein
MNVTPKFEQIEESDMDLSVVGSHIEEVIVVRSREGNGTKNDPARIVTTYWSKDGELLAVADPIKER